MLQRMVNWSAWLGVLGIACSHAPDAAPPKNSDEAAVPSATAPADATAPSSSTPAAGTSPADPAPVGAGVAPGPAGATCGGIAGLRCQDGLFCDYPLSAHCGAADQSGTCQPKPEMCTKIYQAVCGCDGKTYGNPCEARGAGVSVANAGECGKH